MQYNGGSLADSNYLYTSDIQMYTFVSDKFTGEIKSRDWIGTHQIEIVASVGEDGKYGDFTSSLIWLTMEDPCEGTTLKMPSNSYSILSDDQTGIASQSTTIGAVARTYWSYEEFPDEYAENYPDVMYELCGPRKHTIAVKNKETGLYEHITSPNTFDFNKPYLQYWKYDTGLSNYSPEFKYPVYEFILTTNNDAWIGIYEMELRVSLEDYDMVAELVVPFTVTIGDCEVTSIVTAASLSSIYEIGNTKQQLSYVFTQTPCNYAVTYTAKLLDSGEDIPEFMHLSSNTATLAVESSDAKNAGDYLVQVTATLSNIFQLAPAIGGGNTGDYLYPTTESIPSTLIYQQTILIDIKVTTTEDVPDYIQAANTAPYMLPAPVDVYIKAKESLNYMFGQTLDLDEDPTVLTVDTGVVWWIFANDFGIVIPAGFATCE